MWHDTIGLMGCFGVDLFGLIMTVSNTWDGHRLGFAGSQVVGSLAST